MPGPPGITYICIHGYNPENLGLIVKRRKKKEACFQGNPSCDPVNIDIFMLLGRGGGVVDVDVRPRLGTLQCVSISIPALIRKGRLHCQSPGTPVPRKPFHPLPLRPEFT